MSVKISARQNSRRRPPVDNAQSEVLLKLGLEAFWTTPLDPASMLDINTWNLENQPPVVPNYLPLAFLQRLWLLNPDARSTYCQPSPDSQANTQREDMVNGFGEKSQCAANPLDLVTAVYMSANTFLQQDITVRMAQCQFAVPLVLPSVIPDQQSSFLLWPLRGVVSQWRSHSPPGVFEGDMASTKMPMMSFVKLGHCSVSKSRVLSRVLGGPKSLSQSFLHRGMDGGKVHRRLSNGLVELAWYLPTGDPDTDIFPAPVAISNLRGDAAAHEKCLSLLCRASSAVVVFCGTLREKEKRLLASWKGTVSKLILIDLSDLGEEENEKRVVGFVEQKLGTEMGLPEGSVLLGGAVSEELLADRLLETLNDLLPGKLKHITLEEAAGIAAELGLNVDEGPVCNKARATVEEVLKGLEQGSAQFREEQLPLQGAAWSTLSEMEKVASKQKKSGEVNIQQQNEARNILLKLSSYRMTPAMKVFTDALFTTDKMERTYFLRWMKLSLWAKQMREIHSLQGPIKNQQELLVQGSQEDAVNRTIVGDYADDDAGEVALNNSLEESTDENMESEEEPVHRPSDDDSFCTASTEENNSVEDMLEEKPLSMDHTEESEPQFPDQQTKPELDTENDVKVHEAGDSPIKHELELICAARLVQEMLGNLLRETGILETQAGHIAKSEEVTLNSVLPDAGEVALNNLLEESTDENMESEEPVHRSSDDDSFCTASTEEGNTSVEDILEEKTLSMHHTEESEPQFPDQQTKPELDTENDVKVHVEGDSRIKPDLESICAERLVQEMLGRLLRDTEIQKLGTQAGHIVQSEEVKLNSVLSDEGEVALNTLLEESTDENMESEEPAHRISNDDSFCTASTEEENNSVEDMLEENPLSMDHTEESEQQTELELDTDNDVKVHVAGDSPIKHDLESNCSEDLTEIQKLETEAGHILAQCEEEQLNTVLPDAREAAPNHPIEESTEKNMESEEELVKKYSEMQDRVQNLSPQIRENADLDLRPTTAEQNELEPTIEQNQTDTVSLAEHGYEPDPFSLGLEHFLREMGLIFELTHISPGNGSDNVLRLPSVAADLLLYGIPLELMDGDASNIPSSWLGRVLAEFKRRLPAEGVRIRVLTNLGVHPARNGEVLSALFGTNFPTRGKGYIKGIYMQPLCLPDELRRDMECDLLLMIDVEGLCSPASGREAATQVHDNEMATVATGLSDVLLHNLASNGAAEFESNLTVLINALLRTEVCGNTPVCKLLIQDEGLNSKLQALQLRRVAAILQAEPEKIEIKNNQKPISHIKSSIPCLIGPWQNISISQPVDKAYSEVVLQLKQSLFEAFGKCAAKSKATGLPEFMGRLCAIWEAVKAESFSIGFENTEVAASFSMISTELSQWEKLFLENMEIWFMGAQKRITSTKTNASETRVEGKLLSLLKDEAKEEVKAEVDKIRSKLEAYLIQNDQNKTYIETYHLNILNNMNELQEQVTEEMVERLELAKDNHYVSTQLRTFEAFVEKEQELKLRMLVGNSKLTTVLLEDMQLEEEFEGVWDNALSTFDLRPSETSDINTRVIEILIDNLNSRGLQKHMMRLQKIDKNNTAGFEVKDEHFGYNTRMKYMFEDNNKKSRLAAHHVACTIVEEYNRFVAEKSNLLADFSDGYITELLENVEKTLRENPMEIRSAFEVDLKVYICGFACKDFQEIHDRYAKDRDLLAFIKRSKERRQGEFIYQFRKRDQCHRVAQAFTSMVFKPTALDYIYESLGRHIVEEMVSQENGQQYLSPLAFNCSLLEKLLDEDSFESFLEYLLSYESFSLKKIQESISHLSKSAIFDEWRQQCLGEIVGKMSAAVSQTSAGVSGKLSDTKLLLEMVCLNLEKERDVDVTRASLDGPLFSITVEWDYFVSCLLEALAEMRLALVHESSQDTDIAELLQALPVQPHVALFNRVRGCEKQCPFCRAPCEVGGEAHDMHRAMLHRPKGMLSYTCHDSRSLSHTSCPSDTTKENLFLNKDTDGQSLAYRDYSSLYPDWNIHPVEPDTKTPIAYWRYVLMRFNERFAEEYGQQPAQLPEDWLHITREEALESLREASTLSSAGGYHNNYT